MNMMVHVFGGGVLGWQVEMFFANSMMGGENGHKAQSGEDNPGLLQRKIRNLHVWLPIIKTILT
jgi:hypothetical protein